MALAIPFKVASEDGTACSLATIMGGLKEDMNTFQKDDPLFLLGKLEEFYETPSI